MSSGPWTLPDELRQLAESDEGLVKEVLHVFQTDTTDRLSKLRAALDRNDLAQVRNQAHAIKGSAGQVGAIEVAALCREIESRALASDPTTLRPLLARVETAFEDVCRAMSA